MPKKITVVLKETHIFSVPDEEWERMKHEGFPESYEEGGDIEDPGVVFDHVGNDPTDSDILSVKVEDE